MLYPQIPADLKQAPYHELTRAEMALRHYKNVTILGIRHWRAIPQLCDAAKQVTKDQRRVLKEIKARPEFHRVIMPSPESREIIERLSRHEKPQPQLEQINIGGRVHSAFHNADGEVVHIEYSSRVGAIYHVRLDDGQTVYCAREDLTSIGKAVQQ